MKSNSAIQATLEQRLRSGDVLYDLGANIGLFSLLGAQLVGDAGRVFSFEPDHEIAQRLKRNIHQNRFDNITVIEAGAWSSSEMMDFMSSRCSSPDRGVGTFMPQTMSAVATKIQCFTLMTLVLPHHRLTP